MTFNLFDITLRVAQELGITIDGTATAGAVNSLTDTVALQNGQYGDDFFNNGTLWLVRDAGGLGAAPQGEYARISDFVKTTGVVSLSTSLTVAIASGDTYALANKEYPRDTIINQINKVLRAIFVMTEDISTITTASDQTEYNLPAALLDQDIEVFIQGKTLDTNDYKWQQMYDWYIRQTASGTQKLLVFKTQPPEPYLLRLVYYIPHAQLSAATDKLHESADLNRVALESALECLRWKRNQPGVHKADIEMRIGEMTSRSERAKWTQPMGHTHVKLATWGDVEQYIEIED